MRVWIQRDRVDITAPMGQDGQKPPGLSVSSGADDEEAELPTAQPIGRGQVWGRANAPGGFSAADDRGDGLRHGASHAETATPKDGR